MATIFGGTADAGATDPSARAAFFRVFNLKNIGITFLFCVLLIVGRVIVTMHLEPLEALLHTFARATRANVITGLMLLFGIASLEWYATARSLPQRSAVTLGVLAAVVLTALSFPVRLYVDGSPLVQLQDKFPSFLATFSLWAGVGGLASWLFYSLRHEERARADLADAECRRQTLQAQMVEARLSALQAQIEPHFLFNTLANVKRLYETAPHQGREMLSSLISYLRAALPSMRQSGSTLGRELELARSFLTILKMRMGERLNFSIETDPALDNAQVPPMVLPTLVENAIKHGLSPLPEGGRIDIVARRDGDALLIDVRDNGAGFSSTGGSGVGLANTRSRLAALYGTRAAMSLLAAEPRGVVASVRMPLTTGPSA
jgi:sensor histidine kinase YesM